MLASRCVNVWATAGSVMSSAGTYTAWTEVIARAGDRRDPLLQRPQVIGQRRLVADLGGEPAQQSRDFRAGLDIAEDVVDQEHHLVLPHVSEVLGHGQGRQGDAEPAARRVAHLAEDQDGIGDDARLLHLVPEVVALAGPLADAREDGDTRILLMQRPDELLEQHGLAHARTADQAGLAPAWQRRQQVDDLDPRLEELDAATLGDQGRGGAVDRPRLAPGQRGPPSSGSPSTLNSRPSADGPTGTMIGRPVRRTVIPRARPSVGAIAMARTVRRST